MGKIKRIEDQKEQYKLDSRDLLKWIAIKTEEMGKRDFSNSLEGVQNDFKKFQVFSFSEKPPKAKEFTLLQVTFFEIEMKQSIYCFPCCARRTRTTNFCSSIRKARTILSFTAFPLKHPPYARLTVFFVRDSFASFFGRAALMPLSFSPLSPHFGMDPGFLVYKYTSFPPGVFDILLVFDFVLYDNRLRRTKRAVILMLCFEGQVLRLLISNLIILEIIFPSPC